MPAITYRIAGMDPGLVNFGFCISEATFFPGDELPLTVTALYQITLTPPKELTANSIKIFLKELDALLLKYRVDFCVLEKFVYRPGGGMRSSGINILIGAYMAASKYRIRTRYVVAQQWKNWVRKITGVTGKGLLVHRAFGMNKNSLSVHSWDAYGMSVWCAFNCIPFDLLFDENP